TRLPARQDTGIRGLPDRDGRPAKARRRGPQAQAERQPDARPSPSGTVVSTGAAGSLREGLEETLTLQRLGVTGALYRTVRSTNAIENLNGLVGHFVHNV